MYTSLSPTYFLPQIWNILDLQQKLQGADQTHRPETKVPVPLCLHPGDTLSDPSQPPTPLTPP